MRAYLTSDQAKVIYANLGRGVVMALLALCAMLVKGVTDWHTIVGTCGALLLLPLSGYLHIVMPPLPLAPAPPPLPPLVPPGNLALPPGLPVAQDKAGPLDLYPDPTETPGCLNSDVTQGNVAATIGVPGWTATIRPSSEEMAKMKGAYCARHGIADPTKGEWDHFVSLELGGHPRDPRNLWWQRYEPTPGAREKDRVENALKRLVVGGQITLAEAQRRIMTDWYASFLHLNKAGLLPAMMVYDPSGDGDADDNA